MGGNCRRKAATGGDWLARGSPAAMQNVTRASMHRYLATRVERAPRSRPAPVPSDTPRRVDRPACGGPRPRTGSRRRAQLPRLMLRLPRGAQNVSSIRHFDNLWLHSIEVLRVPGYAVARARISGQHDAFARANRWPLDRHRVQCSRWSGELRAVDGRPFGCALWPRVVPLRPPCARAARGPSARAVCHP